MIGWCFSKIHNIQDAPFIPRRAKTNLINQRLVLETMSDSDAASDSLSDAIPDDPMSEDEEEDEDKDKKEDEDTDEDLESSEDERLDVYDIDEDDRMDETERHEVSTAIRKNRDRSPERKQKRRKRRKLNQRRIAAARPPKPPIESLLCNLVDTLPLKILDRPSHQAATHARKNLNVNKLEHLALAPYCHPEYQNHVSYSFRLDSGFEENFLVARGHSQRVEFKDDAKAGEQRGPSSYSTFSQPLLRHLWKEKKEFFASFHVIHFFLEKLGLDLPMVQKCFVTGEMRVACASLFAVTHQFVFNQIFIPLFDGTSLKDLVEALKTKCTVLADNEDLLALGRQCKIFRNSVLASGLHPHFLQLIEATPTYASFVKIKSRVTSSLLQATYTFLKSKCKGANPVGLMMCDSLYFGDSLISSEQLNLPDDNEIEHHLQTLINYRVFVSRTTVACDEFDLQRLDKNVCTPVPIKPPVIEHCDLGYPVEICDDPYVTLDPTKLTDVTIISAPMGSGKTTAVAKVLNQLGSWTSIVCRVSLGAKQTKDFNGTFYQDVALENAFDDEKKCKKMVITYESLHKHTWLTNVLVMDETSAQMDSMVAKTNGKNALKNCRNFQLRCQNTPHLIFMDANLETPMFSSFLSQNIPKHKTVRVVRWTNKSLHRNFRIYLPDFSPANTGLGSNAQFRAECDASILKCIKDKEKHGHAFSTKKEIDEFLVYLVSRGVKRGEILIYTSESDDAAKRDLQDVNRIWGAPHIRYVLYTGKSFP